MYAGFDIGGTHARLAVFDDDLAEVGRERRRIRGATSPAHLAEAVADMLEAVDVDVESVGIGIAGQLTKDGRTVVNAPNLGWRDVAFAAMVEERLGEVPVRVVNDLSALLWGEHHAGAVIGVDDVLAVYVGTGVGGAILADGLLIDGAGGKAGEIGHAKVDPGGRQCGCGQRGCLEAYAGGVHLEDQIGGLGILEGAGDALLAAADDLAASDDRVAEVWQRAAGHLGAVLADACTLLNPAVLLLGGGVWTNLDRFRDLTLRTFEPLVLEAARRDLEIRAPKLADHAGVLGAALMSRPV